MSNRGVSESVIEQAALAWLEALGYSVMNGSNISVGEPYAERSDSNYRDVVLEGRLRQALVASQSGLAARGDGGRLSQADAEPTRRR